MRVWAMRPCTPGQCPHACMRACCRRGNARCIRATTEAARQLTQLTLGICQKSTNTAMHAPQHAEYAPFLHAIRAVTRPNERLPACLQNISQVLTGVGSQNPLTTGHLRIQGLHRTVRPPSPCLRV